VSVLVSVSDIVFELPTCTLPKFKAESLAERLPSTRGEEGVLVIFALAHPTVNNVAIARMVVKQQACGMKGFDLGSHCTRILERPTVTLPLKNSSTAALRDRFSHAFFQAALRATTSPKHAGQSDNIDTYRCCTRLRLGVSRSQQIADRFESQWLCWPSFLGAETG